MRPRSTSSVRARRAAFTAVLLLTCAPLARAMERVTLTTGFEIDCIRREPVGDRIRLYLRPAAPGAEPGYMDVPAAEIVNVETVPDPLPTPLAKAAARAAAAAGSILAVTEPTAVELAEMLAHAGAAHHIDAELLASVVHAESGGHTRAVSRTGAQGLMQLMPGTASDLGVQHAFVAAENVEGGTKYLDQMLTRYHDNVALALAAYNAGPAAVDRYRGVPPFRETRTYVARVIREFNRRKSTLIAQGK